MNEIQLLERKSKAKLYADAYRIRNREKVNLSIREWYKRNKEHKNAYSINYYKKNKDRLKEVSRNWYWKNRDHALDQKKDYSSRPVVVEMKAEYMRRWSKTESGRLSSRNVKMARRSKKSVGSYEMNRISKFLKSTGKRSSLSCYYCSIKIEGEFHIDHMVPLSRGGEHKLENLCVSCPGCNHRKHSKTILEWKVDGQQLFSI